jgi:hypothetical protein
VSGESELRPGEKRKCRPGALRQEVACPAGNLVTGGGWSGTLLEATAPTSEPAEVDGAQGWAVILALHSAATGEEIFHAAAECAS